VEHWIEGILGRNWGGRRHYSEPQQPHDAKKLVGEISPSSSLAGIYTFGLGVWGSGPSWLADPCDGRSDVLGDGGGANCSAPAGVRLLVVTRRPSPLVATRGPFLLNVNGLQTDDSASASLILNLEASSQRVVGVVSRSGRILTGAIDAGYFIGAHCSPGGAWSSSKWMGSSISAAVAHRGTRFANFQALFAVGNRP